ncbi:MAG: hypothetical protein AAGA22_03175 [Pseudomonadota bacterium]
MLRIKSACVVVAFTGLFSASAYAEQCEGPNGNCGAAPIEASNDAIVGPVSFGEKPFQLADASQAQSPTLSERVAARRASPRSRGGSVYGGFGNQVFATAGAVFAAEDDNADLDALGLSGTFGYGIASVARGRASSGFSRRAFISGIHSVRRSPVLS